MSIQLVIAKLEGTVGEVAALGTRLDGLARWMDRPAHEKGSDDHIPAEHSISITEIDAAIALAEGAMRSADAFAPGSLAEWERLRAELLGPSSAGYTSREQRSAHNFRAYALLLRQTAGVLRSLASQQGGQGV